MGLFFSLVGSFFKLFKGDNMKLQFVKGEDNVSLSLITENHVFGLCVALPFVKRPYMGDGLKAYKFWIWTHYDFTD